MAISDVWLVNEPPVAGGGGDVDEGKTCFNGPEEFFDAFCLAHALLFSFYQALEIFPPRKKQGCVTFSTNPTWDRAS